MDSKLNTLVEKLRAAFGPELLSVVLYGSAVDSTTDAFSDVNILCVLRQLSVRELRAAGPVVRYWREQGCPAPLLFSKDEIRTSLDCFSIEFHDIKERHRILYGDELPDSLAVDYRDYRAHVERELRVKLLRLRQKATGVLSEPALVAQLMVDSVSTFCALMRHSLRLAGQPAPFAKREVVAAASAYFDLDPVPFQSLLNLREDKSRLKRSPPAALFELYLSQIEALVRAVDRLES